MDGLVPLPGEVLNGPHLGSRLDNRIIGKASQERGFASMQCLNSRWKVSRHTNRNLNLPRHANRHLDSKLLPIKKPSAREKPCVIERTI